MSQQNIKLLVICIFCMSISFNFETASAQGTNLLQNYLKQYFREYSPNTVRSYTLYGNGQNGVADFQAGLPYPLEKEGKVNNLVYSQMANALPNPNPPGQRTASSKSFGVLQPQPQEWVNPINSFNPYSVDPNQVKIPLPDVVMQYVSSSRSDLQMDPKDDEEYFGQDSGEIAMQSSLAFRR